MSELHLGKFRITCADCFAQKQCIACSQIEGRIRAELLKEVTTELREMQRLKFDLAAAIVRIENKFGAEFDAV